MPIALRPSSPDDAPFLFEVYCGTRAEELAAWGWDAAQQSVFLRVQFQAQQQHYRARFPDAEHLIILRDGAPIGQLTRAAEPQAIRLVDIALLPEARGAGVGGALIRQLQAEAERQGACVRLSVLRDSRAARLYARLGFAPSGGDEVYMEMEWRPGADTTESV